MVVDGAQKPALVAAESTVYDQQQRTGGALRHKHQGGAGRQLLLGSSPLSDVRQTRVVAAAGWMNCGMNWDASGIVDELETRCQVPSLHTVGSGSGWQIRKSCSSCWWSLAVVSQVVQLMLEQSGGKVCPHRFHLHPIFACVGQCCKPREACQLARRRGGPEPICGTVAAMSAIVFIAAGNPGSCKGSHPIIVFQAGRVGAGRAVCGVKQVVQHCNTKTA